MSDFPKVEVPESCCEGEKNKDVEKIKELLDDGCFDCCTRCYPVSRDDVKEVWTITARMAEKIVEQESSLEVLYGDVDEYEKEIARLKAELDKFQQVVTSCNGNDENIRQITHYINRAIIEGRENDECNLYWIQCWDLLREIKDLKAEIASRPETLRCADCPIEKNQVQMAQTPDEPKESEELAQNNQNERVKCGECASWVENGNKSWCQKFTAVNYKCFMTAEDGCFKGKIKESEDER